MILVIVTLASFFFSGLAYLVFLGNMSRFTEIDQREKQLVGPKQPKQPKQPRRVSVLIPARDEQARIERCVLAALASDGVEVEVVVLDDHSVDQTAAIVNRISQQDDRVRLAAGDELPDGWNGKQHACWQLSQKARYDTMMFLDSDVRLHSDALIRLTDYQQEHAVSLLSAFPRQQTGTWLEHWIIPLMHYILLCYLPIGRMRQSTSPAFASGCGQLFVTNRRDYQLAGTHRAIAESRHDGLKLPRAYRLAGLSTDVLDGSQIASCRMYHSASEVIRGVLKNADEGIATPARIVPFSVLLLGGSVMPWIVTLAAFSQRRPVWLAAGLLTILIGHLPRAIAAVRFRQSWIGVLCHGPAVATFLFLQWLAWCLSIIGYRIAWRGRT